LIADHQVHRLYREIMREAVLLGDRPLIELVLLRIGSFSRSTTADKRSNVISFPCVHSVSTPELTEQQNRLDRIFRTVLIPLGMVLFLLAVYYAGILLPMACQT
jgi:hypothetical protein